MDVVEDKDDAWDAVNSVGVVGIVWSSLHLPHFLWVVRIDVISPARTCWYLSSSRKTRK
jgi:hypothetical protein